MVVLQLSPVIPVVTPKGKGLAWFLLDYGEEHHLMFTVAIDESGELWTFPSIQLRADKNITMGRTLEKEGKMIPTAKGTDHEIIELKNRVDSLEDLIDDIYNMNNKRKISPLKIYAVIEKDNDGKDAGQTYFFDKNDAEKWMVNRLDSKSHSIVGNITVQIIEVYVN